MLYAKASFLDLKLCKELSKCKTIDKEISQAISNQLVSHLWHLNPVNVAGDCRKPGYSKAFKEIKQIKNSLNA